MATTPIETILILIHTNKNRLSAYMATTPIETLLFLLSLLRYFVERLYGNDAN
jgi:hypothetical protein